MCASCVSTYLSRHACTCCDKSSVSKLPFSSFIFSTQEFGSPTLTGSIVGLTNPSQDLQSYSRIETNTSIISKTIVHLLQIRKVN